MKAEILCIGTELLLGETVNTNASFLSQELAKIGIDCYFQTTTGDNTERIKTALDIAFQRSDLVITSGGLGPTDDDVTIQAVGEYFMDDLVTDENSLKDIECFLKKLNRDMSVSNKKQALRPKNSQHIKNLAGTAPGLLYEFASDKILISLPGVPYELYEMWNSFAKDYLAKFGIKILVTKHLKFSAISEAKLGEVLKDLMTMSNPTVAPLVMQGEPHIRIGAKAKSRQEANELIKQTENLILSRVGKYYYASDNEDIEDITGKLLKAKNLTLAVAESCTGGLISSRLTDVSGSSKYISLNLVTYSNESKMLLLKVKENTLKEYGAVSEQTAVEMANGAQKLVNSDIGLSITGIAGPTGGCAEKSVGLAYVGIYSKNKTEVHKIQLSSNLPRNIIKDIFSQKALNFLRNFILNFE